MRTRWVLALLLGCCLAVGGAAARTQDREPELRTVRGTVVDREENSIANAVVYLKNLKTRSVQTHSADDAGHYRFSGLDPNVDYEIHAEHKDMTSPKRTISSFDSRKDIVITLKVNRKKSEK